MIPKQKETTKWCTDNISVPCSSDISRAYFKLGQGGLRGIDFGCFQKGAKVIYRK